MLSFDFEVVHVPGVTLGIFYYMSRYPTFSAAQPPQYDELFVVKSIERRTRSRSHPQEGVAFLARDCYISPVHRYSPVGGVDKSTQRRHQSNRVMKIPQSYSSTIEGVELCSDRIDQSSTSMLIKKRNPETLAQKHCL